ncbi:IS3 family transposase, partial [Oceanispirochaeta sp. M2]
MGGRRGRLIPEEMRKVAVVLILEANKDGARIWKACEALEISVSTFERWRNGYYSDNRKGANKTVARKLTKEEKLKIIDISCSVKYKDDNPYKIHASLLNNSIYIASISSFYRVLKEEKLNHHRGNTRPGTSHNKPPELIATGPNQVWTWDITWLHSYIRGIFYYAYTIIDIWDRSIVKWAIHDREDDVLAQELFQSAFEENGYPDVFVHSDNGNPMKGISLMTLFYDLGISNSYSRPRVSDDNPFIESWFKTLKYHVSYPGKFKSIAESREWFAGFVHNYNTAHSHSGLNFITPFQVRNGNYKSIIIKRNKAMIKAQKKNPLRWSNHVKQ